MDLHGGASRPVLVVFDGDTIAAGLEAAAAMLGQVKTVHVTKLGALPSCLPLAILYDIDIDVLATLRAIKARLSWPELRHVPRFLVSDRLDIRNRALNALLEVTDVIERPVRTEDVLARFQESAVATFDDALAGKSNEMRASLSGLNRLFGTMLGTQAAAPSVADVGALESPAVEAIRTATLGGWLDAVARHHSSTFRHCLSVTGIAVAFAQHLGFSVAEQRQIARGAIFHDIGKASIPLAILDKPARLSTDEIRIMQTHPQAGHDKLVAQGNVSADVLDVVLHHHELLDGTGYPHGLSGDAISLQVRLITIADIYSALIERRAYKQPMKGQRAYGILWSMVGMLDRDLTRSFEAIAMG